MSRSNNTDIINPACKFFEWQGSTGKIKYFDKEKKENIILDLPFTFLVLDKLATITGFYEKENSGFWSNEVRSTITEPFTVRTKKGVEQVGLYKDLAPTLNKGAQFCQSVYIAYFEGDVLTIGNIKMQGSSIGAWIDFCKGKDIYKIAVTIAASKPERKGATNYFVPVFQSKEVSEATNLAAIELDKELQEYLKLYFARQGQVITDEAVNKMQPNPEPEKYVQPEVKDDKLIYENASAPNDDLPF